MLVFSTISQFVNWNTDSLVGNKSLRSVISNVISGNTCENGRVEQGMKRKSYFITFCKFSVTG